MRIVDVCAFYSPRGGGVRTYVESKLMVGPKYGHEIIVIAPGTEHRIDQRGPGATLITLPQPRLPLDPRYHYFDDVALLHRTLDDLAPDLVEASSPWRSARYVAEWPGPAPRSLIMHSDPLSAYAYRYLGRFASRETIDRRFEWFWRYLRSLNQSFDLTVTASDWLTDRLVAGGLDRVVTNPMGVASAVFSPAMRDEALRARLLARFGLGPEATLLIGAGRHASEKRWPMIFSAVTAAASHTPLGLLQIGDGPGRTRLQRLVRGNPHIHLLRPTLDREGFARLLASGDALIHGGAAETFCIAAAEARASGLPLIVPDEGAIAEQARLSGGMLYPHEDPAAAAQAIVDFATGDRVAVRARAAAHARGVRVMEAHFVELFDSYQRVVDAHRSGTGALRHPTTQRR